MHDDPVKSSAAGDEKPQPFQPNSSFVEGTVRGWLAVIGGSLVLMATLGNIQSFGVFQDFYTRTYFPQEAPSTISWIGSLQISLQFIVGVVSGKLFDNGYFYFLMIFGSLLFSFSIFMLSLVKPHHFYQALLSQGFGMGIASGLLFVPSVGLASHYFRRRRAVAIGIMMSCGSLGGIIYSILLNNILAREEFGFQWAVRFVAFTNLFLLLIANVIMKPRYLERSAEPVDMKQIRVDGAYWMTVAGLFLGSLGLLVPYFYLQLFSAIRGVDGRFLVWVIPILNAGAVAGRLMPSFMADRYGPLNIFIPCGLLSGGLMWALLGVKSIAGMTIFALIYGFTSGAYISLSTPTLAAFSTNPNDIGLRIGIGCFFIGLGLLGGNPIAGALLSAPKYVWWRPLTFGSVTVVVGTALVLYARQAVVKRRGGNRLV